MIYERRSPCQRVTNDELHAAFAKGWLIKSIEPSRFEVRPDLKDLSFSEDGPKAWFVGVRSVATISGSEKVAA